MKNKTAKPLVWKKLVSAEPQLGILLAEAQATERDLWATRENGEVCLHGYRSLPLYFDVIRPTLQALVGEDRRGGPDFLMTREAYDLALRTVYGALPDDFTDDEIAEVWERAFEAELDEGEEIVLAGPDAA